MIHSKKIIQRFVIVIFCCCCTMLLKAQTITDTIGSTPVSVQTVIDSSQLTGSGGPWDLHWGPDNKLWFTAGKTIRRYDPATHQTDTILTIPKGYILGIATHSNFSANPYCYVTIDTAATYASGNIIELYRYEYSLLGDSLFNPLYILKWWHPGEHSGGRVIFGQDNKVYVTTADYLFFGPMGSQIDTLGNNSGKILRVNPDGTVPPDNHKADYTYSWGHRNPQGIVQLPNGNIIASEHGQSMNDELNLIVDSNYYGWPVFNGNTCSAPPDTCTQYAYYKKPLDIGTNPPAGIDYYNHPAIPEFNGVIEGVLGFGTSLNSIIAYGLNDAMDSVVSKNQYLTAKYGRIRDVCTAPTGEVYFIAFDRSPSVSIKVITNPHYTDIHETPGYKGTIVVYPNPFSSNLTIQIQGYNFLDKNTYLIILNSFGQEVYRQIIGSNNITVPTENLTLGVYYIMTTDAGFQPIKIVKH